MATTPPSDSAPASATAPTVAAQLDPTRPGSVTQADGAPPATTVRARVRRAVFGTLPMALLRRFIDAEVVTHAAALAFYAVLSIAPLLLLMLWFTASSPTAQTLVLQQIGLLVGREAQTVAQTILDHAQATPDTGSLAGWWSIGLLFVGASTVFAQLQQALNVIFRTDATALAGIGNWVRKRLLSFGLLIAVGFLLVVSLTVSTVLELAMGRLVQGQMVAGALAGLVVYTLAFAFMYRYLPDRRVRWPLAFGGGGLTALLFLAGRAGITWYLERATTAPAYGAMGALVLAMLWVYYAAVILYTGAVVTATIDERRGVLPPASPADGAAAP